MKPAPRQPPAPRPRTLRNFFATCTLGLEEVIAAELRAIGAEGVSVTRGGAAFLGDLVLGWRANLELRSATRVQELIAEFRVADDRALYDGIRRLDWSKYMSVEQTLAVDATVRDSALRHSGFVALKVKDAIVDQFREQTKRRPSVDTDDPHLPLNVMLKKGIASVYRNFSGASLHKRGYREAQVKSPLNEATAAGLLLLSGWDWKSGIVDPMCGSATFLIEAAWIALGRAPGLFRKFAFERWPDFDRTAFQRLKESVRARERKDLTIRFQGADSHPGAIALGNRAIKAANVSKWVEITQRPLAEFEPTIDYGVIITNPPWGERLRDDEPEEVETESAPDGAAPAAEPIDPALITAWRDLGRFLHQKATGKTAFVLCGNPELPKLLGLKADRRHPVKTGPIDCRLLRYSIFAKPE
jgi:putative N6-adenine-specific DNA methylase